ncbi:hypothetical protein, partial [Oleiphilus sp. HI0086]|uniref:hypothetical protein n=1 Tax=Oleiphilus sp. HI0086 TaxID=1822260 RepID=UPI000B31F31C
HSLSLQGSTLHSALKRDIGKYSDKKCKSTEKFGESPELPGTDQSQSKPTPRHSDHRWDIRMREIALF